jgi:hypothetical protein
MQEAVVYVRVDVAKASLEVALEEGRRAAVWPRRDGLEGVAGLVGRSAAARSR